MDRHTLAVYGWVIVIVLILGVVLLAVTPLSTSINNGIANIVGNFIHSDSPNSEVNAGEHIHSPGEEATCTSPQLCISCGVTILDALGHNPSDEWLSDSDYHWHTCLNNCGTNFEHTSHTPNIPAATATEAKYCTICAYVIEPATGEEGSCEHSYTVTVLREATCTMGGAKIYTCTKCGTSYNAGTAALPHSPGAAATCTTAQTCTVCGATITGALGHAEVTTEAVSATCTTTGSTAGSYCSRCGVTVIQSQTIPKTGHNAGPGGLKSSCTVCTTCGITLSSSHSMTSEVTSAATCTEKGTTRYYCSSCGYSYSKKDIAATGHVPGAAATCTTAQTCTGCGTTITEAIGHNYVNDIETSGLAYRNVTKCKNCGDYSYIGSWITSGGAH